MVDYQCNQPGLLQQQRDQWIQWRREGRAREGGRPGQHFAGTTFEGQQFGILAFALQCVSVSLYLFLIYSVHWELVLPVGGTAARTIAPGGKNPRAATEWTIWSTFKLQLLKAPYRGSAPEFTLPAAGTTSRLQLRAHCIFTSSHPVNDLL